MLTTPISGAVTLLHDLSMRNVVDLLLLIAHAILLIKVLGEGLVVRYRPLAIKEQAVVVLRLLTLRINGTSTFVRFHF